ncbi:protein of unknown function [Acidithiobacillus ferrivorans]|uniref:Uncharacterized protein n=1 Tax=Acidithiobacillus ferrivorans TaxID=160808 RepID=A0ABY1MUR2_9PROT|nr:protein of unknown function [Acidithiobacillus ferrivorans]
MCADPENSAALQEADAWDRNPRVAQGIRDAPALAIFPVADAVSETAA